MDAYSTAIWLIGWFKNDSTWDWGGCLFMIVLILFVVIHVYLDYLRDKKRDKNNRD